MRYVRRPARSAPHILKSIPAEEYRHTIRMFLEFRSVTGELPIRRNPFFAIATFARGSSIFSAIAVPIAKRPMKRAG